MTKSSLSHQIQTTKSCATWSRPYLPTASSLNFIRKRAPCQPTISSLLKAVRSSNPLNPTEKPLVAAAHISTARALPQPSSPKSSLKSPAVSSSIKPTSPTATTSSSSGPPTTFPSPTTPLHPSSPPSRSSSASNSNPPKNPSPCSSSTNWTHPPQTRHHTKHDRTEPKPTLNQATRLSIMDKRTDVRLDAHKVIPWSTHRLTLASTLARF